MRHPWFDPEILSAQALMDALIGERNALIGALAQSPDLEATARKCAEIVRVTERLIEARTEYDRLRLIAPRSH